MTEQTTLAPDEVPNPDVGEIHFRSFDLSLGFREERTDGRWEYLAIAGGLVAEAYSVEDGARWHCKLSDWRGRKPTLDEAVGAAKESALREMQRWRERFLGRREGYERGLREGKGNG